MSIESTIVSVVISIITGILSGYIVTKYYRWKDSERDRGLYLTELFRYLMELGNLLFDETIDIMKYDFNRLIEFFSKTDTPNRYRWIKFSKKDVKEVGKIEKYITGLRWSLLQCQINSMRLGKGDEEKEKLDIERQNIILQARIDYSEYMELSHKLIGKYQSYKNGLKDKH